VRSLFADTLQMSAKEVEKKIPRELGVALGSSSFTPIQLTQMYAAMLNRGERVEPRDLLRIEDNQGRQIWEAPEPPSPQRVMDPAAAYVTLTIMQAVVDNGGTAAYALKSLRNADGMWYFDVAGKTGTTSKYVDAWFVGLVSDEATVMWVGNDNNTTLGAGRSGSGLCAPRFADYIRATRMNDRPKPFAEVFDQTNIVRRSFCSSTGLLSRFPGSCEDEVKDQAFIRGTEPTEFDPSGMPPEEPSPPIDPNAPTNESNPPPEGGESFQNPLDDTNVSPTKKRESNTQKPKILEESGNHL
ncbi:MAG TPA: penicillin-binding transpeptidase domain-containing protein, partial [Turneriella sp.]|nr:penicillin-binding transpeptidase domain-containing protein [Turneriella sp.]